MSGSSAGLAGILLASLQAMRYRAIHDGGSGLLEGE
jgi:hypothetical protein